MEESLHTMVDGRVKKLTKIQVLVYVAKWLIMERKQSQADVVKMIADSIQQERENLRAEISSQINNAITNHILWQVDSSARNYMSGHILYVHPTQATPTSVQKHQQQLYLTMRDNPQLQQDNLPIWLALKYKFERLHVATTPCRPYAIHLKDQDNPPDDSHPEGENSAKRQKTSKHGTFVFGESSSGQDYESEPGPSTSGNQEQLDDFDFWTDSYATDDDEIPNEKVLQDLVDEMLHTVDEAKLRKVDDEMESRKKILVLPHPQRPTSVVQSCQRDPKTHALSLVNLDLLYLKKGSLGTEKIVMSLHKFPAFITEIIAKRENGSIVSITESDYKNLNKNDIEDMYLLIVNNKVDDYAETSLLWSLSVFIRSIVIWERVHDFQLGVESYQQKVNLTAPTITFPGIEKFKVFSIVSEPVYGIIYKNNKKEKSVIRHQEVHKFCDATLKMLAVFLCKVMVINILEPCIGKRSLQEFI
ncbi:hypothetical protein Tco_0715815 [Tanacetum coccineum]